MGRHLLTYPGGSMEMRAMHCWNAGMTMEDAKEAVYLRFGHDRDEVEKFWRGLEEEFGEGSIPLPEPRTKNQDPAYTDWKGETGPGAELRRIIDET